MTTNHPYGPHRYVEVRIDRRLLRIRVLSEVGGVIKGWRVTPDGERWERVERKEGAEVTTHELVVAMTQNVRKELRLNLHYCQLEMRP